MGDSRTAKARTIDAIIANLDPTQKEIANKLRTLIKRTLPKAVETVKWGNITYLINAQNLVWLLFYRDHVNLGFFMGAKLKSQRLEGTGIRLRHVKIADPKEIDTKEFTRLLRDAAKLLK